MIARPSPDDYAPYYAHYVAGVPDGDPVALLGADLAEARAFYEAIGDEAASRPYAPGKWTPKDVLLHIADNERVMTYRALRIARGDATALPGYDQDAFQAAGGAAGRPLASLLDELATVRAATVSLFASLDDDVARRRGTANDVPMSVAALLFVIAGHERHHRRILREHGLGPAAPAAGAAAATR